MLIKKGSTISDLLSGNFVTDESGVRSITITLSQALIAEIEKEYGNEVFQFASVDKLTQDVPNFINAKTRAKSSTTLQKAVSSIEVHRDHLARSLANLISTYQGVLAPKSRVSNASVMAEAARAARETMLNTMPGQAITLWAKQLNLVTGGKTLPELRAELLEILTQQEETPE